MNGITQHFWDKELSDCKTCQNLFPLSNNPHRKQFQIDCGLKNLAGFRLKTCNFRCKDRSMRLTLKDLSNFSWKLFLEFGSIKVGVSSTLKMSSAVVSSTKAMGSAIGEKKERTRLNKFLIHQDCFYCKFRFKGSKRGIVFSSSKNHTIFHFLTTEFWNVRN